ncbi:uncharacterized protein LOC123306975 [Coccinella septempunctata]|uniref:uncharacterized protein LOC123306975 n=1 Tax=Coccinella septempunctata TaxID=41139 RepID=UPI001D088BC2|nr:uncharacterized protein LOC123306975 [Coccinella septempunctata]
MKKDLNSIKRKIRNNDLVMVRADKGSCMVILERNLYIRKVEEFMRENGFVKLNYNPTSQLTNRIKNFKVSEEFENTFGKYKRLIHPNPRVPKLYGLPKLHKVNIPIRPVVSYTNTPAYRVSKFVNDALKELSELEPKYSIKKSGQLAESLKDLQIPDNAKLISLDAKNLITLIPPKECILLIEKELLKKGVNSDLKKDIIDMLKLSLKQNFCQFNNQDYRLEEGLPMGAPHHPYYQSSLWIK